MSWLLAPHTFWLGTHHPDWLSRAGVPLFVSRNRLTARRTFPRAVAPWALDSGGFTEISKYGYFRTSAKLYALEVKRFSDHIGSLAWVAPQDWMCEPVMLQKTGLTVEEHQRRTITNYLELRSLAPDIPWIPVLQGWTPHDYFHHAEDYERAGVPLATLPLVGVGSVCRRQSTITAGRIFAFLKSGYGLRLHGFGVKTTGLRMFGDALASADSLAWSYAARREPPLLGHSHKNCANCIDYAMMWRDGLPDKWIGG